MYAGSKKILYMILVIVIAAVGAGFLTNINMHTSIAKWTAYLAITGTGIDMALHRPYSAVQVVGK